MSMQTAGDIPLLITSDNTSSERRISPSWTIGQLKAKLELITGVPSLSQKLAIKIGGQVPVPLEAYDEEHTQLANFDLAPQSVIHVSLGPSMIIFKIKLFQCFVSISLQSRPRRNYMYRELHYQSKRKFFLDANQE